MDILVTGGAGFIGSHAADLLLALGHRVTVLDNLSSGSRDQVPPGADFLEMDLDDPRLPGELARRRPGAIFHCAAQVDVRTSCLAPVLDAKQNILGTLGLIEASLGNGLQHFVFASSGGAIYGEARGPQGEDHPERPVCPYGVAKLAVDKYLQAYSLQRGLRACSLRFANVYGPRQGVRGDSGVVAAFCRRLRQGQAPVVHGDGLQTRDFVFVGDLAEAVATALERRVEGIYNLSTGRETTILDLAHGLCAEAGVDPAGIQHLPAIAGEQRRSVLDPSKAKAVLGWSARTPMARGLAATWRWFSPDSAREPVPGPRPGPPWPHPSPMRSSP